MKRKLVLPPVLLVEHPPNIFEWSEMVKRMEASCTLDHGRQWRGGGYGWECDRCNDLYALALIHANCGGEVPAIVVLDRLLGALEGTGEKAA